MNRNIQNLIAMVVTLGFAGCSSHPQAPQFPELDPEVVATKAIQQFDADGNKLLDSTELSNCPSLAASMKRLDQDNDGQVSEQELKSRLSDWLNSGTALVGAIVQVTINGKPLVGAEVTVEPEEFLGEAWQPASGATDDTGMATFTGHDPRLPGLHLGFYRVRISKRDDKGEELLPAKYNSESELGVEIAGDKSNLALFKLASR